MQSYTNQHQPNNQDITTQGSRNHFSNSAKRASADDIKRGSAATKNLPTPKAPEEEQIKNLKTTKPIRRVIVTPVDSDGAGPAAVDEDY